ncbi:MAG TPA: DNA polymerase III subunit beta [Patescibacteria group bacterium]|nr:DNA polymerase III subunit beta [Patescibacteria group bacterium]
MKAEFLIENVEGFLPTIAKILPIRSQIPVLANILIEANKDGIFISATNLEIGTRIKIPGKVEEDGATTVPGKQFIEVLSSFPKDKVSLVLEKDSLVMKCRDNKASLQTIAKEEFPTLFEEYGDKIYEFDENEMGNIFSKVIFAASIDEGRPELTGVYVVKNNESTDFVATDGFRLSLKKVRGEKKISVDTSLIIPSKIIGEVIAAKTSGPISMFMFQKANQVVFESGDILFVGRLINGDFPNYQRVIPKSHKTEIEVDSEELSQKLKLSSIFARDNANVVKLNINSGKIEIHSQSSGLGQGDVELAVKQDGEDNEISFNVKYITDALKYIQDKQVVIDLLSPVEPAVFKSESDPDFIHIIMPVRVQE